MNDRDVIDAFVAYLRENGHPGLRVDRHPDKDNRNSADIDALAGQLAIEHTSIHTVPNQRRDSDWFMCAAGNLEQELDGPLRLGRDASSSKPLRASGPASASEILSLERGGDRAGHGARRLRGYP